MQSLRPVTPFSTNVQSTDHCRKALGRRRHRARAWRLHQASGPLRERPLCAVVRGRASARTARAGEPRRQAWQVDLHAPAGDTTALRPGADRPKRSAAEGAGTADQAQGRDGTGQRLRRRARRRAHISLHRAGHEGAPTCAPPVAAVDDAGLDPRGVRNAAQRRRNAAAGGCRAQPFRGRLAGRHQRHARDDRVQQQGGRFLSDHRRPRADADAGDRCRTRRQDPPLCVSRLLGGARTVRCHRRPLRRPLVRPRVQEDRRR